LYYISKYNWEWLLGAKQKYIILYIELIINTIVDQKTNSLTIFTVTMIETKAVG